MSGGGVGTVGTVAAQHPEVKVLLISGDNRREPEEVHLRQKPFGGEEL
ncbi:MAG: hypothetical protein AAF488_12170 [Planctomycetota bacterium]